MVFQCIKLTPKGLESGLQIGEEVTKNKSWVTNRQTKAQKQYSISITKKKRRNDSFTNSAKSRTNPAKIVQTKTLKAGVPNFGTTEIKQKKSDRFICIYKRAGRRKQTVIELTGELNGNNS